MLAKKNNFYARISARAAVVFAVCFLFVAPAKGYDCPATSAGWTAANGSGTDCSRCSQTRNATSISVGCSAGQLKRVGGTMTRQVPVTCKVTNDNHNQNTTAMNLSPWQRLAVIFDMVDCALVSSAVAADCTTPGVNCECTGGGTETYCTWASVTDPTAFAAKAGYYISGTGANKTCTQCPAGRYQSNDNSSVTSCTECPAGTYATGTGNTGCTDCAVGTYASGTGNATCTPCPTATVPKSTSCPACPAGSFLANGACTECAQGSYSTAENSPACTACQGGKTTAGTGSTASTACIDCTNTGGSVAFWANTEWNNNTMTHLCRITGCQSGSATAGTGNNTGSCVEASNCADGQYLSNGICNSCTNTSQSCRDLGAITTYTSSGTTATDCKISVSLDGTNRNGAFGEYVTNNNSASPTCGKCTNQPAGCLIGWWYSSNGTSAQNCEITVPVNSVPAGYQLNSNRNANARCTECPAGTRPNATKSSCENVPVYSKSRIYYGPLGSAAPLDSQCWRKSGDAFIACVKDEE